MANIEVKDTDIDESTNEQTVPESQDDQKPVEQGTSISGEQIETAKKTSKRVVLFFIALIFLTLLAGLVLLYNDRNKLESKVDDLSKSQQTNPADEAKQLHSEVTKLIELPADEIPTVATVVDADKVKNQAFFIHAQNGDKVLLYAKSSKAILYRTSSKKIVEVSPINLGTTQNGGTTTQAAPVTTKNR